MREMAAGPVVRPARSLRRQVVVAVAVFAVCAAVAAGEEISRGEVDVFRAVARLPDALDLPLRAVMQLGTLPATGIATGVLLWVTRRWQGAVAVAAAGLGARFASDGLKELVDRPRPTSSITDVVPRDTASGLGFPSTHSAVAFAMAAVVVWWLPRPWRASAWVLAALVAFARVFVGVHYPLDVGGGAAVGVVVGSLAVAVFGVPARGLLAPPARRRG